MTEIPPEIGKLEHLVRLNLSRNHLKDLPRELFTLPNLRYLNLAYNEFEELNPDISDLHMLEILVKLILSKLIVNIKSALITELKTNLIFCTIKYYNFINLKSFYLKYW